MITSPRARRLVTQGTSPAFNWQSDDVLQALEECRSSQDIVGASALFSKLNQEHKCFFGYDFRVRTITSALPESDVQEAIVLNCGRAAQYTELIRLDLACH